MRAGETSISPPTPTFISWWPTAGCWRFSRRGWKSASPWRSTCRWWPCWAAFCSRCCGRPRPGTSSRTTCWCSPARPPALPPRPLCSAGGPGPIKPRDPAAAGRPLCAPPPGGGSGSVKRSPPGGRFWRAPGPRRCARQPAGLCAVPGGAAGLAQNRRQTAEKIPQSLGLTVIRN